MSEVQDLLIELGTEELPPKGLGKLIKAFEVSIEQGLVEAKLGFKTVRSYAAPRRLAVIIEDLETQQSDRLIERRGPATSAAFDASGQATKALQGFARSCGVDVEALEKMETDKGAWLVFKQQQPGAETSSLIGDILQKSLLNLPIAKRMRWSDLPGEFVRPVHWLVVLFGQDVLPVSLLGVTSSNTSRGHRFHHPDDIEIESVRGYVSQLEDQGKVLVDMSVRKNRILEQVIALGEKLGGRAVVNEALLNEVTGLVEWPVALSGEYDRRF